MLSSYLCAYINSLPPKTNFTYLDCVSWKPYPCKSRRNPALAKMLYENAKTGKLGYIFSPNAPKGAKATVYWRF